jgi:hypothetical protein
MQNTEPGERLHFKKTQRKNVGTIQAKIFSGRRDGDRKWLVSHEKGNLETKRAGSNQKRLAFRLGFLCQKKQL